MREYIFSDRLEAEDIKALRRELHMTQAEFAALMNVSKPTVERWEMGRSRISGSAVPLVVLLLQRPELLDRLCAPAREYPMRLWYMYRKQVCTIIDVDERRRRLRIRNYVEDPVLRAFGREENPSFEQYEEFLESRCFPRTRDKMKLVLQDLGLPYYDPLLIVEKTEGRMAEDEFWIRMER